MALTINKYRRPLAHTLGHPDGPTEILLRMMPTEDDDVEIVAEVFNMVGDASTEQLVEFVRDTAQVILEDSDPRWTTANETIYD